MLRKILVSSTVSASAASVAAACSSTSTSYSRSAAAPSISFNGPMKSTKPRLMFQNKNVQNQWTNDTMNYAGRRSDYDFDKEAWAKQMKFASFDCIMEPSIIPPKYTSFEGIKKNIRRYLNMKKLSERRPGYNPKDLEALFTRYKYLTKSRDNSDSTLLLRMTTHTEANRIEKEIVKKSNEEFKNKSWGSMKLSMNSKNSGKVKSSAAGGTKSAAAAAAATNANASDSATDSLVAAANNANDVVLMIKKPAHYDIHILDFQLVTSYMAQMASEDWLQLTFKCEYLEKEIGVEGVTSADGTAQPDAALTPLLEGDEKNKAEYEKALLAQGYRKVLEYPCFELRMGDGVAGGVQYPFIVLGVMRRDGTRYGRDAQDAAQLRKQFDRNRSWFS